MTWKQRGRALRRGVRESASVLANVAATPRGVAPGGYRAGADGRS